MYQSEANSHSVTVLKKKFDDIKRSIQNIEQKQKEFFTTSHSLDHSFLSDRAKLTPPPTIESVPASPLNLPRRDYEPPKDSQSHLQRLERENSELANQVLDLSSQNKQLVRENAEFRERIAALEMEMKELKRSALPRTEYAQGTPQTESNFILTAPRADPHARIGEYTSYFTAPRAETYTPPYRPATEPYSATLRPTDTYSTAQRPTDMYSAPQRPTDTYSTPQRPTDTYSATQRPADAYSAPQRQIDSFSASQRQTDAFSASQRQIDTFSASQRQPETYQPRQLDSYRAHESVARADETYSRPVEVFSMTAAPSYGRTGYQRPHTAGPTHYTPREFAGEGEQGLLFTQTATPTSKSRPSSIIRKAKSPPKHNRVAFKTDVEVTHIDKEEPAATRSQTYFYQPQTEELPRYAPASFFQRADEDILAKTGYYRREDGYYRREDTPRDYARWKNYYKQASFE